MHFVVAVDGSDQGERALAHAIDVASGLDADLTVAHAVEPGVRSEGGERPVTSIADAEERLVVESVEDAEERGQEVLDEAAAFAADQDADVETVLLYGDPATQVASFAADQDADGIFVGHRGLDERRERLLGSVAKDLLELAEVPVTVVR